MTKETVSARIREKRKEQRLTQQELADKAGVSLKTVQRWENGERSPRVEEMNRLAEVLQVSSAYLMGTDDSSVQSDKQSITEPHTQERNTNMATFTTKDGMRFEAPATPDGYAYLERMFERLFTASMSKPATV